MIKMTYVIWRYMHLIRSQVTPSILIVLISIAMNRTMKDAPFWIPMLGTPLQDIKHGISYYLPYTWICVNSIFLYIGIDCLWKIWRYMFTYMRLKGMTLLTVYTVIFLFNVMLAVTLVFAVCCLTLVLSFTMGNFYNYYMNLSDLFPTLILWVLGTTFSCWIALLISIIVKNVYIGFMSSTAIISVSGLLFPNFLWLPGTQWIYGTHIIIGGPSFIKSGLYLVILIIVEFFTGYWILKSTFNKGKHGYAL